MKTWQIASFELADLLKPSIAKTHTDKLLSGLEFTYIFIFPRK